MRVLFRFPAGIMAFSALAILFGCLSKEKGKPLNSGGMVPPWDSAHFQPKRLEAFRYAGPDSLFAVFKSIAEIDSQTGDQRSWAASENPVDTLGIAAVFDTGFIFPSTPEASLPYAYDDSFRDDTLFRNAFGNGLFMQDHPCAAMYVLSGQFLHPARWLRAGMKMNEVIKELGTPLYRQNGVVRYLSRHAGSGLVEKGDTGNVSVTQGSPPVFEGINFYFRSDSLFAAVLQKSQPCH